MYGGTACRLQAISYIPGDISFTPELDPVSQIGMLAACSFTKSGQLSGASSLACQAHVYTRQGRIRAELSARHVSKAEVEGAGKVASSQASVFGKAQFLVEVFQTATGYGTPPEKSLAML